MKKIIILCALCINVVISFAQRETYDLVSYTAPKTWKKEVIENITSYTIINNTTKSWCRINIIKSTVSKGDIDKDFESEWQELIVKSYQPAEAPVLNEVTEAAGWKIKAGSAKFLFNNTNAVTILTTATGFERCVSIVATTNSTDNIKDIEAFLASVELKTPETTLTSSPSVIQNHAAHPADFSIIGTWGISVVVPYRPGTEGTAGSNTRQYTFNANGTYSFLIKTFSYHSDQLLLTKESGVYQISENRITISPQKSIIESWSKKAGTDNWGKRVSTKPKALEKISYRFTKHYAAGLQEWNLVLQADKETQRDGPYNGGAAYSNAWLYSIPCSNCLIQWPGGQQVTTESVQKEPAPPIATNSNTSFLGTWVASESDNSNYRVKNGVMSTIWRQYTFNVNGTYTFYSKAYDPLMDKTLLGRESGTYQISGNTIIVTPRKSVLEAWSKTDNRDVWGKKLNSQNIPLETASYRFTKNYSDVMGRWELVLQVSSETKRDGHFSSNNTFSNAYYYPAVTVNNKAIVLPD